ncbi:MAG: LysM peptidoglycan-binding domain-containing protein [Caldilineaceae bacterium]|nr:LysM peptidoglycan-binding domain-containing protein [Caldilineaceae bacterium]
MYFATIHRMAHQRGSSLGRRTILYCRLAAGLLMVCSALLLMPTRAHAQGDNSPGRPPIGAAPAGITPVEMLPGETISLEALSAAATPSAATSTESDSAEIIHVIEVGDNLTNVAQRYNIAPGELAAYNHILDYNHVIIGQKLRIPPVGVKIADAAVESTLAVEAPVESKTLPGFDGYHVIRKGESLGGIARLYNLTLDELIALNDITDINIVQMGKMLRLTADVEPATHATRPELAEILYVVEKGDNLSKIARAHSSTIEQIMSDNNLTTDSVHVGQELRILPPSDAAEAFGVNAPVDGERRIVIDLSDQTLTAYQGDVVVLHSIVSTGKDATPTRVGEYAIYLKYKSQHMYGDDYDLPGVPWVMYYDDEYAIHGAYWHANFGVPTSHGCTNMTIPEAKALYTWAPEGTPVTVQW